MTVLGLDTTGPYCSVSIVNDAQVLAHISENIGRGHAEALAPMVARALDHAGLTARDITKVAVCKGPGSFTGLRVALSFAKGFALPRKLPVVGIDALEVTAKDIDPSGKTAVSVYQDIRRNEIMFARYEGGLCTHKPSAMSLEDAKLVSQRLHEVTHIDTRILAWLAMDEDPADYPAIPLYSRGPDAKLPGGKSL